MEKIMDKRSGITFSRRNFLSHSGKKLRGGALLCFRKFLVWRKLWMRGGVSRFSVRNFLTNSAEKHREGTLLCFRNFGVSKKFMHNRGYHKFPSKIFCLTVPKNFVGIPSMFQKIWGIEKFYGLERWREGVSRFEIVKIFGAIGTPTRDLPLQNHVVLTPLLSFFLSKKSWQFWTARKEKGPY